MYVMPQKSSSSTLPHAAKNWSSQSTGSWICGRRQRNEIIGIIAKIGSFISVCPELPKSVLGWVYARGAGSQVVRTRTSALQSP